jgi:hypothetical protein
VSLFQAVNFISQRQFEHEQSAKEAKKSDKRITIKEVSILNSAAILNFEFFAPSRFAPIWTLGGLTSEPEGVRASYLYWREMRYDESFFFSTSSPPPLLQGLLAAHAQCVALREQLVQVQIAAVLEGNTSHKHSGILIASH